jgi:small GTP-binding protein
MGGKKSKPKKPPDSESTPNKPQSFSFKFLIVGEPGVGKTSLLLRFTDNTFSEQTTTNIGEESKTKEVDIDGHHVTMNIYDTAGQEKFRKITFGLYRNADGIALVYDISKEATFQCLDRWLTDVQQYKNEASKIVVGNKMDLESERKVPKANGEKWATSKNLEFIETSAKTGDTVTDMFTLLARQCLQKKLNE